MTVPKNKPYFKKTGMTMVEMAKKFKLPLSKVFTAIQHGRLDELLKNPKKFRGPCHWRGTKWIRVYGYTLKELGERLDISKQRVHQLERMGKLRMRLKEEGII